MTIGAGTVVGPHVVADRPHDGRRAQPVLPVQLDRRDPAGPQVRRRADHHDHRRRQRRSASTCRSTPAPRRTAATRAIGNGNLFLAYTHVAHDCVVGNFTTFSNNAQIAGHVVIGDWVVLGAYAGVHQFCRVGAHAMIAAGSIVLQDVPPFVTVAGLSGQAARHQQRGPAPARLHGRRTSPRCAAPTRRSTARGCRSTTRARGARGGRGGDAGARAAGRVPGRVPGRGIVR